ncbi:MAG TPA: polysaccharide deacetylase family protein [Candidatus Saccharimonadales bacterium]|jgi:hypothetical protein|nr:polysaccharide deacetylase family protein [Candidatus Saccharimonadales bacterium]
MRQAATAICVRDEVAALPNTAIAYGLKELARRAGVSSEFFKSWRIEFDDAEFLKVFVKSGTRKLIRFPRPRGNFKAEIEARKFRTSTATWLNIADDKAALVPSFKIPFSSSEQEEIGPLFLQANEDQIDCSVDLLTSIVLTLGRFEETIPGPRDEHGRFSVYSSVAWRDKFFHRPIVDEYGLAFREALETFLPGWQAQERSLKVHIGHDVDEIGTPFSFRTAIAHTIRRGRPMASVRDLAAPFTGIETTYQRSLRQLVKIGKGHGFRPATYWKAGTAGPHDTGYDPRNKNIRKLMSSFRSSELELGIHLSYDSYDSLTRFQSEVSTLRDLLGQSKLGGRQDFLRWNPQTWVLWDSMNLAYDASVGYADQIGFRAGTCLPFRPWLLSESREANLIEVPLTAMDSALFGYLKLGPDQALSQLLDCVERCRNAGGVFTTVWHNTTMMRPAYIETYRKLLGELQGSETYDWTKSDDGRDWV